MEAKEVEDTKSKGGWGWWLVVFVIGALVIAAGVLTLLKDFDDHKNGSGPGHHGAIVKKYADAVEIALHFFDVQKCNTKPLNLYLCLLFWGGGGGKRGGHFY